MTLEFSAHDAYVLLQMAKSALRHTKRYVDENPDTFESLIAMRETIPEASRIIADMEVQIGCQ